MKSRLLSRFDTSQSSQDSLKRDIEKLTHFSLEQLKDFPNQVARIDKTRSSIDEEREIEETSKKFGVRIPDFYRAYQVAKFFMKQFLSTGVAMKDTPEEIVDDLEELGVVTGAEREKLISFLTCLKKLVSDSFELDARKRAISKATLPALSGIEAAINYRAVFNEDFLTEKGLEEYNPKCLGIVPITTINISLDEGPIRDIYFQVDKRDLRILIEHLEAVEKEFAIADRYLNLKS